MERIRSNREFMKSVFASLPTGMSDQSKGVEEPPLGLPPDPGAKLVALPKPDRRILSQDSVYACMEKRRSRRRWTKESLSLEELSFLLWATQGVEEILGDGYATLRVVPSGGARHAFETYLIVNRVKELDPGVYRYLPLTHQPGGQLAPELVFLFAADNLPEKISRATFGQKFVADGAVVFLWSCIPYRGEWRYTVAAHKLMLLDAGHVCQNLYLGCEAIGAGTCAVGAYDQEAVDALLKLDGEDEFVISLAPVGRPQAE